MSGTEIAPYTPPAARERAWLELLEPAARLANEIARTNFVPTGLRGDTAAVTAAILYGDEVGLPPMQALAKVHVIEGRPALAAEAQRALILAAGHEIWIEQASNSEVTVAGKRAGSERVSRITWTLDDARRASLDRKKVWASYPRAMLTARASAELARALFPDVIGGLAAVEELEEPDVDIDGTTGGTPAKKTTKAKRTRKAATPGSSAARTLDAPATTLPPLPGSETGPPTASPPPAAPKATTPPPTPSDTSDGTEEPHGGPSLPWPNYYAMKCGELGYDDDERHALTSVITEGRTEASGEMSTDEQDFARTALENLAGDHPLWKLELAAGIDGDGRARTAYRLVRLLNGEIDVVRSATAENPTAPATGKPGTRNPEPGTAAENPTAPSDPDDDDEPVEATIVDDPITDVDLRRLMRTKGIRVHEMLKKAGTGRDRPSAPASVSDVLDEPDLARAIVEWLNGLDDKP